MTQQEPRLASDKWRGRVTPLRFGWQSEAVFGRLLLVTWHRGWHFTEAAAVRAARKKAERANADDERRARARDV